MKSHRVPQKGRGAQSNRTNRYSRLNYDEKEHTDKEEGSSIATQYLEVFPKTLINAVKSRDIPLDYSMNPYEGCEHGCVYCYARNTHPYWGYNAGLDFERVILVKKQAPELLKKELQKKSHVVSPIMLSGNTDCYQPVERKLEITRNVLKVLLEYKHPVGIITKNSLILRDIDLLQEMAQLRLVQVIISITTLNEDLRRTLEPRTVSALKRLETVRTLTEAGIPVLVNIAPIIPGLNDPEILAIAKAAADAGALGISYNVLRLPGEVEQVFTDWLEKAYPMRMQKVLNQTAALHGGQIQDTQSGRRMRGDGVLADSIRQQIQLARKRYFAERVVPELDLTLFDPKPGGQMRLF